MVAKADEVEPYVAPTRIKITKEQAGAVSIGDNVDITVSGEVTAIQKCETFSSSKTPNTYEVELKPSKVVSINPSTNTADKALKKLTKS